MLLNLVHFVGFNPKGDTVSVMILCKIQLLVWDNYHVKEKHLCSWPPPGFPQSVVDVEF